MCDLFRGFVCVICTYSDQICLGMCSVQAPYPANTSHLFLTAAVAAAVELRGYITPRIRIPRLKVALIYFQFGKTTVKLIYM